MNKSRLSLLMAALGISVHNCDARCNHSSRPRVISQDELAEIKLRAKERLLQAQEKRLRKAEKRKPITL